MSGTGGIASTTRSARAAIREALMGYAKRAAEAQGRQGCLITAAAMEMMPGDAEVSALITRMFRRIEDLFATFVARQPEFASYRRSVVASRNQEFAAWSTPLESGDEIAFLPPVSGG